MQLHALDKEQLVLAQNAEKHKNYQCPECLNKVRVRGGPHRQIHFYHLASEFTLQPTQKNFNSFTNPIDLAVSIIRQHNRKALSSNPSDSRCQLGTAGIVFEIQYSAISLAEAKRAVEIMEN